MRARSVLSDRGLLPLFDHFVRENGEANFNPYHGLRHALRVVETVFSILVFGMDHNWPGCFDVNLRTLILAALFHDFRHAGSRGDDAENVKCASDELHKLGEYEAAGLVLDTVYPYPGNVRELPLESKILRDADVWSSLVGRSEEDLVIDMALGLQQELGIEAKLHEALQLRLDFLRGYPKLTGWSVIHVPECLDSLERLVGKYR